MSSIRRALFLNSTYRLKGFLLRRGWLLSLTVVLLYAIALRLINYTGVLDWDVIEYTHLAYDALQDDFRFSSVPRDSSFRIALIYPLVFLYRIFGPSEFSTVLYPFLCSLLGVLAMYGIGRLVANESAGLITALLWASLPLNVFLSTLFGPDGILASFTVTSVFFLLLGAREAGGKALFCYLLSVFFALLAVFVKPSAIIIFVFLAVFVAYKVVAKSCSFVQSQLNTFDPKVVKTILVLGTLASGAVAFWYFQGQSRFFLLQLYRASTDFSTLLVLGQTQERLPGQMFLSTPLFLVFFPVFIVALSWLLVKRMAGMTPVLLWAVSMFLYFEWGTRSVNPAVYTPFLSSLNDRNVLFLIAPFAVLSGTFLSQWIKVTEARLLALLALLLVAPLAWLQSNQQYDGFAAGIVSFAVMVVVLGLLAAPCLFIKKNKPVYISGFFLIVLIAFLYPTPPVHLSNSYWQLQIGYRKAVANAAQFFIEHPGYPILTLDSRNGRELNWASQSELGYLSRPSQQNARIQVIDDPTLSEHSAYLYFRDEINQFLPVPSHWWKMAEFETGTDRPIYVYRFLSPADALQELASAELALQQEQNRLNLERLLAAGVNAGNVESSITAWIALAQSDIATYPIDIISPMVLSAYGQGTLALGDNLLEENASFEYEAGAEVLDGATVHIIEDEKIFLVEKNVSGHLGIYTNLTLKPNSLYIFIAEVRSSVGVDLVGGAVPGLSDSHNYHDIYGETEEMAVVLATGSWQGDRNLDFYLFTVQDVGFVELEKPRLFEVELGHAP